MRRCDVPLRLSTAVGSLKKREGALALRLRPEVLTAALRERVDGGAVVVSSSRSSNGSSVTSNSGASSIFRIPSQRALHAVLHSKRAAAAEKHRQLVSTVGCPSHVLTPQQLNVGGSFDVTARRREWAVQTDQD